MRKKILLLVVLFGVSNAYVKSQNTHVTKLSSVHTASLSANLKDEEFETIMSYWGKGLSNLKQEVGASDKDFNGFLQFNKSTIESEDGIFYKKVDVGEITIANVSSYIDSKMVEFKALYEKYTAAAKEFPTSVYEHSHAPTPPANICNSACTNVGFEDGNLSGWYGYYGVNNSTTSTRVINGITGGALGAVQKAAHDPNTGNTYQIHLTHGSATDWFLNTYSSYTMSQVSPYGGNWSCMIGDSINKNAGVAILEQTFSVDPSNPNLTVEFALFLELPSHTFYQQPFFNMFFLDNNGDTIKNCGDYYLTAPNPSQAFNSLHPLGFKGVYYPPRTDTIYYKDWTTINVDLTKYKGQCVTVGFEVADCEPTGHCAWAYVDATCTKNDIITSSPAFCGQDSIILTAPPGFISYKWEGGPAGGIKGSSNTQKLVIDSVGTYCVIATPITGVGCNDTICIYIPNISGTPPHPTFTVNQGGCAGQDLCFTNTSHPDSADGATFYWDFYNIGQYQDSTVNPCWVYNASGIYTIKLHENYKGCGADTFVTIKVAPVNVNAVVNSNTTACTSVGSATATPCGGKLPYTYSWSPSGGTNATATGLSAGTYTITVKDNNNISATVAVTITAPPAVTPIITLISNATACANSGSAIVSIGGGASPYSYSWNPGGNTNANATGLSAGTYTVTVTDNDGCTGTAKITITAPPSVTANAVVNANATACANTGSATVAAGGGTTPYTYSWTNGNTGSNATGLSAGSYTVTVTDNSGCAATATVTITDSVKCYSQCSS